MHATSRREPAELALVLHFHQPVGNFGHVFEKVTRQCYAPLLQMLFEFPGIKTHLHFNGILLEWFDENHPELIRIIGEMVRRGSVELLTGGHQEPILTVIPEEDAIGQVNALSRELQERFGANPLGAWLTERVWEPRLPTPLARAGVRYVTLDDAIFRWAGLEAEDLTGHYVTDDNGHPLALFPAAKSLRYTIPFRPQQETLDLLHALEAPDGEAPLMVYADDAEKFGEWPGTHEWVFEKGWLREFLEQLRNDEGVRTVHLSERLASHRPRGRVYPPTASYPEMTIWAMPTRARARMEKFVHALEEDDPQQLLSQIRGGHWRGFLAKYPEANRLHKRMLRASRQAHDLRARGFEGPLMDQALRDLYAGQCNDAYWHGVFGGLYLPHLRRAVESFLIRAARSLDEVEHGPAGWAFARRQDTDADGSDEIVLTSAHSQVIVDPDAGGLSSWDLREAGDNWITVMQRHEEPFHEDLRSGRVVYVDEEGLPLTSSDEEDGAATIHGAVRVKPGVGPEDLAVDHHSRIGGLLWSTGIDAPHVDPRRIEEQAEPLSARWDADIDSTAAACTLHTEQAGLRVSQEIQLAPDDASLELTLQVEPLDEPRVLFAEWNLFMGWTGEDLEHEIRGEFIGAATGESARDSGDLEPFRFRGGGERGLRIEATPGTTLRWAPVHTISSSEAGLEKIGQGTCFVFAWTIDKPTRIHLKLTPSAPALVHAP